VNLLRGPACAMSKTGFKLLDSFLHCRDGTLVGSVLAAGAEAQVAGFVAFIDVLPVQFQFWLIPAIERDKVCQKLPLAFAELVAAPDRGVPFAEHPDATPAVVRKLFVVFRFAASDAGGYAIEKTSAMCVIRDDISVPVVVLAIVPSLFRGALAAAC